MLERIYDFPARQNEAAVPPGSAAGEEAEFDIRSLLAVLKRRATAIAGVVFAITALVALVTFQMTPLYSATVTVLIDPRERQVADMESVLSGLPADSAAIDSEVEILKSEALAARVVDELGLVDDPEFNGALRDPSIFEVLNPLGYVRGFVSSLTSAPAEDLTPEEIAAAERTSVIGDFRSRLGVRRQGLTYVIGISFQSESPNKAAKIANAVANAYLVDQLEAKFEAVQRANNWLQERLAVLVEDVRAKESAVELYRAQNNLADVGGTNLVEQQLADLNGQLALIEAERAEKQARLNRGRRVIQSGRGAESIGEVLESSVISDLRRQQAEVIRRRAEFKSRYGDRHPEMIKVQREMQDLEAEIESEARRIIANLENEVAVVSERGRSLKASIEDLQASSSANNQAMVRMRELERDAEATRAVYESFLSRFKETTEQQSIQEADARILSRATAPLDPSHPKKALNLALALMGSLVLGVGAAFLIETLDNGFATGSQIEQTLGLAHIGTIPHLDRTSAKIDGKVLKPQDYVLAKPFSSFAEGFRGLRTSILLSNVDNPPRIVLFTSSLPNEGKTTSSICFARMAAVSGVKTILIDVDLRHPSVADSLMLDHQVGLIEVLAGTASPQEAIVRDAASGLDLITLPKSASNIQDLLNSEALRGLLKRLAAEYELIVLDSPPVLPVADARILSQIADKTVFVVRWQETAREAAVSAIKSLRSAQADIAGSLLAQVDLDKQRRYGYYGSDVYYYGKYKKYYDD